MVEVDETPLKRYQNGPLSWISQLVVPEDYFIHAVFGVNFARFNPSKYVAAYSTKSAEL